MCHSWERIASFAPWVTHGIESGAFIARKMLKSMHNMSMAYICKAATGQTVSCNCDI